MEDAADRPPIEVTVEIPSGSRNKCEYDHERRRFVLDRVLDAMAAGSRAPTAERGTWR